jgi:hypothetical protein
MLTANEVGAKLTTWKKSGVSKPEIIRGLCESCLGWPYVFGAAGELCTTVNRRKFAGYHPEYQEKIYGACPVLSGKQSSCDGCKWQGCRIFDCRGFTRWLLAQVGVPLYGESVTTQWETASNWVARGTIDTLPRGLVCCVFRPGHTGMYQGNGNIIHCSGTVKEEALPGKPKWERWGVPAGLYTTEELRKAGLIVDDEKNTPTLRRGNQVDEVADLQMILNSKYGYELEVDGSFGKATETAVKDFQTKHGLTADGVVGAKTWKALGVKAEATEPVSDDQPPTICIPYTDFQAIRAAVVSAYHIIKKYEGV